MGEEGCEECQYFIKHDFYDFIGLCVQKDKLVTKKERCEGQEKVNEEEIEDVLKERGWVYCISCDEPIFSVEELEDHSEDRVVEDRLSDDVASEDTPAAD